MSRPGNERNLINAKYHEECDGEREAGANGGWICSVLGVFILSLSDRSICHLTPGLEI